MTLTITEYKHIQIDELGNALIAGSTMKVAELATSYLTYGWGAGELYEQYPHLSLGQIYSALAYYWDHKEALDADMRRRETYVRELEDANPESPFVVRMKAEGILP